MADRAHIDVTIQSRDAGVSEAIRVAKIRVAQGVFTYSGDASLNAEALISADKPNDLKLGSDNKLLSRPEDEDFLAYYILNKG